MSAIQIVDGFSKTNRWLLYTSFMLSPLQLMSGIDNNCPSNIGFLAYNVYNQIVWYRAVQHKELHALSLGLPHLNMTFALTYLGGISSGNTIIGVILGLGTAGVVTLNTVTAWTAWAIDQPEGYGVYQFFFFGWRTLSPGWHKFILLWQISDSILAFVAVLAAIIVSALLPTQMRKKAEDFFDKFPWYFRYPIAIFGGAFVMLFCFWPLILWTELIINRNHLESETDMIAVYLFIAQVVVTFLPPSPKTFGCFSVMFSGLNLLSRRQGAAEPLVLNNISNRGKGGRPASNEEAV
jgi:hypothetical protein